MPTYADLDTCGGATNVRRPPAAAEGGGFRGRPAIGLRVDNNWLI